VLVRRHFEPICHPCLVSSVTELAKSASVAFENHPFGRIEIRRPPCMLTQEVPKRARVLPAVMLLREAI
jgi:hypothetical protein